MIFAKPTKYGAGILIYGDLHDLQNLHETIHHLASFGGPLRGGQNEFVLGLAYEVRHAYQGDRDVHKMSAVCGRHLPFQIHNLLQFPNALIFLMQLGFLRWATGFQPSSREHQANLFRLEACAESALTSYDPFIGRRCLEWLSSFQGLSGKYLLKYIPNCSLQYVTVGKAGKSRFKNLPEILRMLSPLSKEYRAFKDYMEKTATEKGCKPDDLMDLGEWTDFKW
jgi:hypothetical protein